jgi:hypothetical protein
MRPNIGPHETRCHRVHPNAVRRSLQRGGLRQAFDCMFGGDVRPEAGESLDP